MPLWLRTVLTRTRELALARKVFFTLKARCELGQFRVRHRRTGRMRRPGEPVGRGLRPTAEIARDGRMGLCLQALAGTILYVKFVLRNHCIVVSFHEDRGEGHEEDA